MNRFFMGFMALALIGASAAQAQTVVLPTSSAAISTTKSATVFSNFASTQGSTGTGWTVNAWGTPAPSYATSIVTGAANVYSPNPAAQKFTVNSVPANGAAHLIYPYTFQNGQTYEATVYLRADKPTTVGVVFRHDLPYYDAFASQTAAISTTWTPVTIQGTYQHADSGQGSLRIEPNTMGVPVYVGQMTLQNVQQNLLAPKNANQAIPSNFFGMVVNKLGVHYNWPGMSTSIIRLWDTGTKWSDIEPQRGVWNFQRTDMYVAYAQQNGGQVMMTLGQTPAWAASNPKASCTYSPGCSPVANLTDWQLYIRQVAQRYGTKIKYWELWNEPDYSGFWAGTPAQLAQMAVIAKQEIKAVNPAAVIVGPSVTSSGLAFLDQFLAAGGSNYLDAISFHGYYSTQPEQLANTINSIYATMAAHGRSGLPLWNTEGAGVCGSEGLTCDLSSLDPTTITTTGPRALFVMAAKGVSNFDYYIWESTLPIAALSSPIDYKTLLPAGTALSAALSWIKGTQVLDAYNYNNVYVVRLSQSGHTKTIVWSTVDGTMAQIPASWKYTTAQTLDGASRPLTNPISLGRQPFLLQ